MIFICSITSVFFGGGTPSLAHPSTIAAVLEAVSGQVKLSDEAEVTLEVNPTPVGKSKLEDYRRAGVNRFSIGVQVRVIKGKFIAENIVLKQTFSETARFFFSVHINVCFFNETFQNQVGISFIFM